MNNGPGRTLAEAVSRKDIIAAGTVGALSINEFCATYGIGRTFTYAEIKAGALRSVKIGRRTLIPAAEARAWLERKSAS